MSVSSPQAVLEHYDPLLWASATMHFLGNAGGFSGSRLWRVASASGSFCLRAWPPSFSLARLTFIHHLMGMAGRAGLAFVPFVMATQERVTWTQHAGRLWELSSWQPGRADFHERPDPARLEAACMALARLHLAWAEIPPAQGPCPAVQRRLRLLEKWLTLVYAGWRPAFSSLGSERQGQWAERAWNLLPHFVQDIPRLLAPWRDRLVPLQPCLCDIWHDHVLFEESAVTGIIDYGSIKQDHVAVDLARLLGSLVGKDLNQQSLGMAAYSQIRSLKEEEKDLVAVLDQTGTVLGAANWLIWLYREGKQFEDLEAVADRLAALVRRLEE